jgi:hypothetical protein
MQIVNVVFCVYLWQAEIMNWIKNIGPFINVGLIELGCQIVKIKEETKELWFFSSLLLGPFQFIWYIFNIFTRCEQDNESTGTMEAEVITVLHSVTKNKHFRWIR